MGDAVDATVWTIVRIVLVSLLATVVAGEFGYRKGYDTGEMHGACLAWRKIYEARNSPLPVEFEKGGMCYEK